MAKRLKTASEAGEKFARRAGQATGDYKAGVQSATGWSEGALSAVPRTHAGLQQAMADNRIAGGIQRTGDAGWKSATLGKGVQNYGPAVAAARPKYEQGMQRALSYQEAARAGTASIDTTTLDGRLQKAMEHQRIVAELARRDKAGR